MQLNVDLSWVSWLFEHWESLWPVPLLTSYAAGFCAARRVVRFLNRGGDSSDFRFNAGLGLAMFLASPVLLAALALERGGRRTVKLARQTGRLLAAPFYLPVEEQPDPVAEQLARVNLPCTAQPVPPVTRRVIPG